jgi:heat shock protein HslJ
MKLFLFLGCIFLLCCKQFSKKNNTSTAVDTTITNLLTEPIIPDSTSQVNQSGDTAVSLHNYWVLEAIGDSILNPAEFTGGTPYFQLDLEKNTVSGYSGCNGMNGSLKVQGKKLVFGKISGEKRECNSIKFEKNYLNNLSGRTISFQIRSGKLELKVADGSTYIYRKMIS